MILCSSNPNIQFLQCETVLLRVITSILNFIIVVTTFLKPDNQIINDFISNIQLQKPMTFSFILNTVSSISQIENSKTISLRVSLYYQYDNRYFQAFFISAFNNRLQKMMSLPPPRPCPKAVKPL